MTKSIFLYFIAAQRAVEKKRELDGRKEVDVNALHAIVIGGQYSIDKNGQQFFLYDSRIQNPEMDVFFIFASPAGLERLRTFRK
jgi:hypothetical protein